MKYPILLKKYSTSCVSIVNLKIIIVKKQKKLTREHPNQGRGATLIYNKNGRDYSFEAGYPFDNSRQIGNTS